MRDFYPADEVTEIEDKAYEWGKTTGLREGKEEGFREGMAHTHEIVYQNIERMQKSINDVMGLYIDRPTDEPILRELEASYRTLSKFRDRFVDDYDDEFRKHKSD